MKTNLYTIGKWYEDKGLVGEKPLALVQTVVCISGKAVGFGIIAASGSGKSATLDLCIGDDGKDDEGLIYKKHVYFKDAGSETSLFYDKKINDPNVKILAFRELQKDSSKTSIEAIKSITEGKNASRKVTDVTNDDVKMQKVVPRTCVFSLATENEYKTDTELERRCITMSTDISKQQTDAVLDLKAKLRWDRESIRCMTDEESNEIRRNVNALLNTNFTIVNPFAAAYAKIVAKVAPDQKVRSMMEHFWDVVEGVTKINALDGNHTLVEMGAKVIVNAQDLAQTITIYGPAFLRDVYGIPSGGDLVLQGFKDTASVAATEKPVDKTNNNLAKFGAEISQSRWVEVNHVRKAIKEKQNVTMSKKRVFEICRQLVDAGYLEDNKEGKTVQYQVIEHMQEFDKPNWKHLIDEAAKLVAAKYPAVAEAWETSQAVPYQDPLTGEQVSLVGGVLDELGEEMI